MISPLVDQDGAEALIASTSRAWVFKHSSTCGISAAAQDEVERYLGAHPDQRLGRVIVQSHRGLSNWLAQRLGYTHQSPQLFLVQGGKVLWAASHYSITAEAMEAAAKQVQVPKA